MHPCASIWAIGDISSGHSWHYQLLECGCLLSVAATASISLALDGVWNPDIYSIGDVGIGHRGMGLEARKPALFTVNCSIVALLRTELAYAPHK